MTPASFPASGSPGRDQGGRHGPLLWPLRPHCAPWRADREGKIQRACLECRRPYEALTAKSRYCSGACRAAFSRLQRDAAVRAPLEQTLREAEERVTALLVYLDAALKAL